MTAGRRSIAAMLVTALVLALAFAAAYAENMDAVGKIETPQPAGWPDNELTIATLGHASVLMNYFGVRVISDPSLYDRVGLSFDSVLTIGPHRFTEPPLRASDLQTVDVILVTHAHMDHLDIPSLKAMPKNAAVITCENCASLIAPLGFSDVRELRWGESTEVHGLKVTAMGAKHWGKRWPWGPAYGFNSFVLEKNGARLLLACDSAYTDIFAALASNPPEVAVLSCGAYDPWIWNHANPEQVWEMFQQIHARFLVPIHWGTFRLSKEPMDEPMKRLTAAAGDQADRIILRRIGGTWTLPADAIESRAAGR